MWLISDCLFHDVALSFIASKWANCYLGNQIHTDLSLFTPPCCSHTYSQDVGGLIVIRKCTMVLIFSCLSHPIVFSFVASKQSDYYWVIQMVLIFTCLFCLAAFSFTASKWSHCHWRIQNHADFFLSMYSTLLLSYSQQVSHLIVIREVRIMLTCCILIDSE